MYKILRTKRAKRDAKICARAGFSAQLDEILDTVAEDPYKPAQHFERLTGDLKGYYSRQINYSNRFLYTVLPNDMGLKDDDSNLYDGIVVAHEAWGHKYKNPKQ
jgi:Txe/YoeB family toxin of toxin-antitoxin system